MDRLVLCHNSIDDDGILELCDCLLSAHNTTLSQLDISETKVGDRGIEGLIETMRQIETICVVEIEGLKEVSKDMREKLDAALRRNRVTMKKYKKY